LKQFSKKDMEEIYEYIGLLDGKIATLTLDLLDDKDISTMNFLVEAMFSAINNELYTKYNNLQHQFHDVYTNKCPNQKLVIEIEKKKKLFIGKSHNIESADIKETLTSTNQEHQKILQLFKEKDAHALRSYIEEVHWRTSNAQYDVW